jgi:predicted ATP-dependent serine protease
MQLDITHTQFVKAADVEVSDRFHNRLKTGIKRIDDFMSGGFLPGSSFTLSALPGTGKTTFLLQILDALAKNGYKVGYISGEENIEQIAYTCGRIKVTDVLIKNETRVDEIAKHLEEFDMIIVDSFQCLEPNTKMSFYEREKYIVKELVAKAKKKDCVVGFVMHMTKDGKHMKGSSMVPHSVDANMVLQNVPDADEGAKVLGLAKNRFGSVNELECWMGNYGYDFDVVVDHSDNKAVSKKSKKQDDMNKILELGESFTLDSVMPIAGNDYCRAQYLLRNLIASNRVEKMGRGNAAVFQVKPAR